MPAGLPATTIPPSLAAGIADSDSSSCLQGWDRKVRYLNEKEGKTLLQEGKTLWQINIFSNVSITELVFFSFFCVVLFN